MKNISPQIRRHEMITFHQMIIPHQVIASPLKVTPQEMITLSPDDITVDPNDNMSLDIITSPDSISTDDYTSPDDNIFQIISPSRMILYR
jgi:hypothetical protein